MDVKTNGPDPLRPTPLTRRRLRFSMALVAVMLAGGLAACGDDKPVADVGTASTTVRSSTSTTAADDSGVGEPTDAAIEAWRLDASEHRGALDQRFSFDCPGPGKLDTVWGLETYTDDSSVCSAAVQVGLITVAKGGKVEVEMSPGQDTYLGGEANGVTSSDYAAWAGSFTFPDAPPGSQKFPPTAASWSRTGSLVADRVGLRLTVGCSPAGTPGSVWGTATYTSDSSICSAAVHHGLITVADGGTVTIEGAAGQDSYEGSTANGITSQDYGSWGSSFSFPTDQPAS